MTHDVRLRLGAVFALTFAAFALFGREDRVDSAPQGVFEFANVPGLRFEPMLFDAGWSRCGMRGGWKVETDAAKHPFRSFEIVDSAGRPVVRGSVTFFCEENPADKTKTARFDWDFTTLRDFDGKTFCIGWSLPCAHYLADAESAVTFGGTTYKLPTTCEKAWIGGASADSVRILGGGTDLRVALRAPAWISLQDDRQWRADHFALRLTVDDGKFKNGERIAFTMSLAGIAGLDDGAMTRIVPDATWVPVADTTDVKAGTALDFSAVGWIDAPAGKYGRVIAKGDHFEFERKPGVKQRFYGVNLCFTANYMSAEDAEKLATRLSRFGYNALRLHHYESELCDRKDGTAIRPEKMAELDNLLNACIRHGIYLTTDLFVSRRIPWRSCGIDRDGEIPMDRFKELALFHDGAFRNYCDFARQLLDHVNPETGRRWADEPALAFLALINEGNLGNHGYGFLKELPEAKAAWTKWLAERKAEEPAVYAAVTDRIPDNCWENSPQNCACSLFLADVEAGFARRMRAFIRDELKSKVLLTDLSCWKNPVHYQLARTEYDYVDDHFYVDHPQFLEQSWRLPSKCPNVNPARGANAGFEAVARHRLLDRPFTITEFNYSGPGQFRGVGGMMLGAQAALQEYDGIWRFAWSHSADGVLEPKAMSYFDVARDPLQRATERAVTMLYLRGDLKPLERVYAVTIPEKTLRSDFGHGPHADVQDMWFGWYSRFGTLVADAVPAGAAGGLFPDVCSRTTADYRKLAEGLRPGDGQVIVDRTRGVFGVDTPRTAGFFAESGTESAGPLKARIEGAPAAVWVSALDAADIVRSDRLLLTHVTDVQDTETLYADRRKTILLQWGRLPHLMHRGTAEIELAFADAKTCRVYALASDGTRRAEIPVVRKGSAVAFTADTARDPGEATCFYEIIREK